MCVIHNSVGSALLVPTVDGHTRASMRGTGDIQFLRFLYLCMTLSGTGGEMYYYYEEEVSLVVVCGIDVEPGFL